MWSDGAEENGVDGKPTRKSDGGSTTLCTGTTCTVRMDSLKARFESHRTSLRGMGSLEAAY
jgi:hypothetical protein